MGIQRTLNVYAFTTSILDAVCSCCILSATVSVPHSTANTVPHNQCCILCATYLLSIQHIQSHKLSATFSMPHSQCHKISASYSYLCRILSHIYSTYSAAAQPIKSRIHGFSYTNVKSYTLDKEDRELKINPTLYLCLLLDIL